MTRDDVLKAYTVDANKVIRTLGKFEGEAIYVPYFWDCALPRQSRQWKKAEALLSDENETV